MIDERLHMLIYTKRNGRIRVISLRKASDMEIAAYENKTQAEHS